MRSRFVLAAVTVAALSGGCADAGKQSVGTGLGAVIGGVAGSRVGSGSGRIVGIAAGAAVGGFIGNRVGKYLNDQDKRRTAEASTQTAETGRPQQVKTASGATVTTAPAPASSQRPAAQTASAQECKTVRQTIVLQNGTSESEDVTMCKGPDGWQAA